MPNSEEEQGLDVLPVAGVLGHNIGYSLSPLLHAAADSASGRRMDYELFDVPPEHLDSFLRRVSRFPDLIGFNVTMPYKVEVARRLDAMHEGARETGAVNTVALRGEHLIGYNTDRPAIAKVLQAELKDAELPFKGWTVVVLGAGGAARAIAWALLDLGIVDNLIVVARGADRLHSLANDVYFAYSRADATFSRHPWLDWVTLFVNPPAMLVNATPLGNIESGGEIGEPSPVPPPDRLRQFDLVFDLVYNPPETELVRAARDAGHRAVGGGSMLIEQAILSRSIWLGEGKENVERMAMVAAYMSWATKVSRVSAKER
jgi:shikimate dehydrogenase